MKSNRTAPSGQANRLGKKNTQPPSSPQTTPHTPNTRNQRHVPVFSRPGTAEPTTQSHAPLRSKAGANHRQGGLGHPTPGRVGPRMLGGRESGKLPGKCPGSSGGIRGVWEREAGALGAVRTPLAPFAEPEDPPHVVSVMDPAIAKSGTWTNPTNCSHACGPPQPLIIRNGPTKGHTRVDFTPAYNTEWPHGNHNPVGPATAYNMECSDDWKNL